ncbi:MAG TPA: hypothetical protein VJO35_12055 [Terriglobales bacterium]|nr:hypothetical protein [Terriglobales bacterium]
MVVPRTISRAKQQALAREEWQTSGRNLPAENSAALRARAIQQKQQMKLRAASTLPGATGVWVSLGPKALPSDASGSGVQDYGFVSGRATAVAIDPNDSTGNTVFVGAAYGGVWKSTTAASLDPSSVTWAPLTDSQPTLAIGSIAVQPQASNPNPANSVVLAGTGETDSSADSYYGLGILRSTNGGQSWTLVSQDSTGTHSFAGLGFSQIAFSTANPNLVVAAAGAASQGIFEGLEIPAAGSRGLYYSTDAGAHWETAVVTDSGVSITPDSATAVVYNAAAGTSGTFFAASRYHGFYSSVDGINWTRLSNQPSNVLTVAACPSIEITPSSCPIYRGEIAVVPGRTGPSKLGEMYVWFVDAAGSNQHIWESTDAGATWTQIDDSGITNCGDVFGGCGTDNGTFNLSLAAVPNLGATDLYAGAVNIYKCEITITNSTCNGTGANTFLNLTHAYGCSDISKVHPGQHAMDFAVSNNSALMFFANDGGVYRSLNAFTGLSTGTCGQTNQFDNLNAALGPMTQFVSIAQSSSDANLIFGGAQDNGAPATASSQTTGAWLNVNAGDNGFTAVNPSNQDEWFVSAPPDSISGVNLFSCASGINCHTLDFEDDEIAGSNSVDGDIGPYYLPFILDPQDSTELILGTCRIWHGSTSGGGFSLLSPDFETGGAGSCSGNEINMVRTLAAGGLKDSNGYSQVIYAGTSGEGPFISTTPGGGHVWVTTNADGGPLTWSDATQGINPQSFPISGIALDSADPLGKTAYATVMGFHTSHVWKTANAGLSWTDFTANLPDAPANTIIVDSGASLSNGIVYVGTDVGVFASSTSAPNWTEVDPASGQSGSLPNVAVTSLQLFNSGGLKRLRAATYGRGIWEWNLITTPDFQLNVTNTPLTIFASQTASFSGSVLALNSYSSNVNLSCAAGATAPPPSCSVSPATVLPTSAGANLSLNVSGPIGDYQFNLHGVGTDSMAITHDLSVTMHVVDFTLSAPSPASVTVAPGSTSTPVSFQVAALGSFAGMVALSCSNMPVGASCHFQPSASVAPTSPNPITVMLTVSTSSGTPAGNSTVAIKATVSGAPAKTQNLNLSISAAPDFAIAVDNASFTASVNASAIFNGTLTAINSYNSSVALTCGTGAPPTCTLNPASITPSASGTPFTVTVSSNLAQSYTFNITAIGSDGAGTTHALPVTFIATPAGTFDFTMNATPPSVSVAAGQTANFNLALTPVSGVFPNNVSFVCSGLPNLAQCGFDPKGVGAGSGSSTVNWSIVTQGALTGNSGTIPGTPPGTYTVVVSGMSGSITHTVSVNLTVTASSQNFDFNLQVNAPNPLPVAAGTSATVNVGISASTVSFPDTVIYSCTGLPSLTTCNFSPAQLASGDSSPQTISLTINTTAPVAASVSPMSPAPLFASLSMVGLVFLRPRRLQLFMRSTLATLLLMTVLSCGGGLQGNGGGGGSGSPGTPPGTYTVSVTASCASITHVASFSLKVTQ